MITAGSSLISQILFGADYRLFVIVTGVTIAFNSIYFLFLELLRFEIKPWLYTIVSTISVLLNILLTIYFVVITRQGVYGAIIASSLAYSVSAAAGIFYIIKRYGFKFSFKWFKNITRYGYPLIGTGIAVWILTSTDRYFLAHYSDLSAVGIYAVGVKIAALMGMVAGAFQMAWGPFSMEIQYEPNAKRIYASIFFLFAFLGLTGIFFVSMFAIDILKVFTQPSYYSAKAVIPFLCLSTVLSSAYFLAILGMNLTKKLEHTIWITFSAAGINIVLNYLLTPKIGAVGAAFSIMTANFIIVVLTLRISQRFYYVRFDYLKIFILAVPAAVIIAFSYYFDLRIIPRIILSFLYFFFTVIFVYKSFKHTEELKNILKKISNFKHKFSAQADSNNDNL
jgi:O-antigen/teichoic acid export membrane protein